MRMMDKKPQRPSPRDGTPAKRNARGGDAARAPVKSTAPGQTPAPAPATPAAPGPAAPAPAAPAAKPTLSLSGDSYNDAGGVSHKLIKFNVAVPAGVTAADYCLVNKISGSYKDKDGKFYKVKMYGSSVDFNFPTEQIDSVDADPVYWSDASARRNYTVETGGFSATDDPGQVADKGDVAALKFKIGLYKLADVPVTTTGTIAATPIQELPWQYSVVMANDGTFTHPAL